MENNDLDQFFTNMNIVDRCLSTIEFKKFKIAIEPSAGDGSFFDKIPIKKVGYDLCPLTDNIIKQDFFNFSIYDEDVIILGNPPFGKNSSVAVKFFNHAAKFADTIAFILPRTFRKKSIINKLNPFFHNKLDTLLPINSFHLPDNTPYSVPCVWQIWDKKRYRRKILTIQTKHSDFSFVGKPYDADFIFQRVGANAGRCHKDFSKSKSSHYLIKSYTRDLQSILCKIDWSCKYDTVGNPSISKDDVIQNYINYCQSNNIPYTKDEI